MRCNITIFVVTTFTSRHLFMTSINQNVGLVITDPVFHGVTISLDVTVQDENGQPTSLADIVSMDYGLFGIAPSKDPFAPVLFKKDLTDGITITDADNGNFRVLIDASDTSSLWPGTYYHQVLAEDAAGFVYKSNAGSLKLSARF